MTDESRREKAFKFQSTNEFARADFPDHVTVGKVVCSAAGGRQGRLLISLWRRPDAPGDSPVIARYGTGSQKNIPAQDKSDLFRTIGRCRCAAGFHGVSPEAIWQRVLLARPTARRPVTIDVLALEETRPSRNVVDAEPFIRGSSFTPNEQPDV